MRVESHPGGYHEAACDLVAVPVFEDETGPGTGFHELGNITRGLTSSVLTSGEFKPELHKTCLLHRPRGLKARMLLLIGAGKRGDFSLARLRELAGTAIRKARTAAGKSVAFHIPAGYPASEAFRVSTEGACYANYEPDAYKTRDKKTQEVELLLLTAEKPAGKGEAGEGIRRGTVIGDATNFARSLVNEPSNVLTPSQFAERAASAGAEAGLEAEVLERADLEKLGMNTMLAVSRGSDEPPKLVILRVKGRAAKPANNAPLYTFVGKGVTFDSGGISLKPSEKMEEMKADMAGGAAVLGAMVALAGLRPARPVMGLIPVVENLPSGKAAKPGDVVRSYSGKTVEIINTDAEGRLILADALAYARTLGANRIIDIATLTGACVIALGNVNAGMMGNDQKTMDLLRKNCAVTGERLWQLPLDSEYRKALDSDIADIKNVGPRWGGAIIAAKFLQEFVEETPWVHLDIAGMDLETEGKPYAAKGATGFGVRTLVQLLS
jgi:leucyl aminopeptidase